MYILHLKATDEVFSGPNEVGAVVGMKAVYDSDNAKSLNVFVTWFAAKVLSETGIDLKIPGGLALPETRAKLLAERLVGHGLADNNLPIPPFPPGA